MSASCSWGGELDTQAQIEKALLPGTTLTDRRDEYAVASIQGPNSRALLQRLTDADVSNEALPYYGALYEVDVAGAPEDVKQSETRVVTRSV